MEFLKQYEITDSDSGDAENSTNIGDKAIDESASNSRVLNARAVRQVYLITYSQADLEKFPTRKSFAEVVVSSFNSIDTTVEHWVCSKEPHQRKGYHYHMAVKLNRCKRWLSSKNYLQEIYGISVHFSDIHYNYYSAWKYSTKKDKNVLGSDNHPDLWDFKGPKTETASKSRKKFPRRVMKMNSRTIHVMREMKMFVIKPIMQCVRIVPLKETTQETPVSIRIIRNYH